MSKRLYHIHTPSLDSIQSLIDAQNNSTSLIDVLIKKGVIPVDTKQTKITIENLKLNNVNTNSKRN